MRNRILSVFFHWLPLGVAAVSVWFLSYVTLQYSFRAALNDPQIQMAQDGAAMLDAGRQPVEVVGRGELLNADRSLAPFIAVYDKDGTPLEASATVNNEPPRPPMEVFEYAREHGEYRVTWQPGTSTRIALVIVPLENGSGWFVAAGRNMREVEAREADLFYKMTQALFIVLAVSLLLDALGDAQRRRVAEKK